MATRIASLQLTPTLLELASIRQFIEQTAQSLGVEAGAAFDLVAAVDEAATNILIHGYQGVPGPMDILIEKEGDVMVVILRDRAPAFDPTQAPDPDLSIPLENRRAGGLGIFLIRRCVDQASHRELLEGGNELTLVKRGIIPISEKEVVDENPG